MTKVLKMLAGNPYARMIAFVALCAGIGLVASAVFQSFDETIDLPARVDVSLERLSLVLFGLSLAIAWPRGSDNTNNTSGGSGSTRKRNTRANDDTLFAALGNWIRALRGQIRSQLGYFPAGGARHHGFVSKTAAGSLLVVLGSNALLGGPVLATINARFRWSPDDVPVSDHVFLSLAGICALLAARYGLPYSARQFFAPDANALTRT